jgi:membrane dipeptidase
VVDGLLTEIEDCPNDFALVTTFSDIHRARADGKVAVLLAFEGAEPLGFDLGALRLFYAVGLRMMSLTWSRRNAFGDGAWENESQGGLTRLGRRAVAEMNRRGIIVDVSHASDRTARDILDVVSGPVVASHSNARALHNHPRNLTDDLIRAVGETDGVVAVTAVPSFISDRRATVSAWVDHLEHVIEVAGIDHVGVGADFIHHVNEIGAGLEMEDWAPAWDPPPGPFEGMLSPEDLPALTEELVWRRYGEEDLGKILSGNYFRVFERVLGGD